jgi:hypothetical protein
MKRVLLFFVVTVFAVSTFAQNADTLKPWKIYGVTSLSINQASFSNWSAGGDNSFSGTALLKLYADYAKGNNSVNTVLNMKYGMLKTGDDDLTKSEDLIELISQYNNQFSKYWAASVQLNFTTQFAKGYDNPGDEHYISKFMAPGFLTIAPGVSYKPNDYFGILMSPITAKSIFVNDQTLANVGAFGVDAAVIDTATNQIITEGKTSKFKFGSFVELYFKKEVKTDLSIESRLNVFYNYLQDNSIPDDDIPVDVNWQTFLNYKLNDWLSANFFIHLAYQPGDVLIKTDDAGEVTVTPNDKLQVKQTFGIGLAYNF